MSFRRMLPFILVNILVSAAVLLGILYWWDAREAEPEPLAQPTAVLPTPPLTAGDAPPADQPAAEPTAEAAAETDGPPVHVVQAGDTLMRIAEQYDVAMEDIMTANGIENPNFLTIGQQLQIPVGGLATPTPPPTATPETAVLPSPNPTLPPADEGTVEVQITEVVAPGDLTAEAVQIVNTGSRQVGLLGWQLRDADGFAYTFSRFTLYGDGSGVLLHTEAGIDSATDLFWGLEAPLWESGEVVTLVDAAGAEQATFVVP